MSITPRLVLKEQQKNYNKSFMGKKLEILFEKKGRYKNQYIGRSIYNQSVFASSTKTIINEIRDAKTMLTPATKVAW